jgi:hypothetical protein
MIMTSAPATAANQYHVYYIKKACKVRAQQNRATARGRGTTALRRWTSGLERSGVEPAGKPDRSSPEVHSGREVVPA